MTSISNIDIIKYIIEFATNDRQPLPTTNYTTRYAINDVVADNSVRVCYIVSHLYGINSTPLSNRKIRRNSE